MDLLGCHRPRLSKLNNSRILNIHPSRRESGRGTCDSMGVFSGDNREAYRKNCVNQEGDLWIVLELDGWFPDRGIDTKQHSKEKMFTVRLSWPASTPADFVISIFPYLISRDARTVRRPPEPPRAEGVMYDLDEHRAHQPQSTYDDITSRRMFARIRASNARFVRSPNTDGAVLPFQFSFLPQWILPAPIQIDAGASHIDEVKFQIVLEPLIMGVLPESALPGFVFLLALLLLVWVFGLPMVNTALSRLASRARKGKGKWNN